MSLNRTTPHDAPPAGYPPQPQYPQPPMGAMPPGAPQYGAPQHPQYPQQPYGAPPQYGQPPMGQPQMGQPQMGQPQFAQPQYGQPQYAPQHPQQPQQYGAPQFPQPQYGQPQYAPQQQPQQPFGAPPPQRPPFGAPQQYGAPPFAPQQPMPGQHPGQPMPGQYPPQYGAPQAPPAQYMMPGAAPPMPPQNRAPMQQPAALQPSQLPPQRPQSIPSVPPLAPPQPPAARAAVPPKPAAPPPPPERSSAKRTAPAEARSNRAPAPPAPQPGKGAPRDKSQPAIIGNPPLVAQPAGTAEEPDTTAEDQLAMRRSIIAGTVSMIVHLVLLIVLGLMVAVPKNKFGSGIALEASIENFDDSLDSEANRIDMTKPETVDAGKPVGLEKFNGSPILMPGVLGLDKVGVEVAPPSLTGAQVGAGGGDGKGDDVGPTGVMDPHTKPGDGNGATFFSVQATGRKIAFVVDTSGSMFENDRYVRCRNEMIESLRSLKPKQYYYVVLFSDRIFQMPNRKMTEATSGNLYRTLAWLNDSAPGGTTEPVPGLKLALQQKPDSIFLLTDGSFEDGVMEEILKLQTGPKKIPIHTIAFEGQEGEDQLKEIAKATGGRYRYVK